MKLSEAAEKFESLFAEVVTGLPQRFSQTGEEYTEFMNDGPIAEGQGSSVYDFLTDKRVPGLTIHPFEESAVIQWWDEASKMALPLLPKTKTLYWRMRPESASGFVEVHATNGMFRVPTWKIYSRFLISDKPRKT